MRFGIWANGFGHVRRLSLHEYDAMCLLQDKGARVGGGRIAKNIEEVVDGFRDIGPPLVIKAQILAGGRGIGAFSSGLKGGVHVVKSEAEAIRVARGMLGTVLVTAQTGASGLLCSKVLLTKALGVSREFYVGIFCDRSLRKPILVASKQGGSFVESSSNKGILSVPVDFPRGIANYLLDRCKNGC